MLYNVIDYDNQVIGQVDARDSIEAWAKARMEYGHLLDVRPATVTDVTIERYHGIIVAVGGINTKSPNLPDWDISYVAYPPGQMKEYRGALMKAEVRIIQVTDQRIYFEQE